MEHPSNPDRWYVRPVWRTLLVLMALGTLLVLAGVLRACAPPASLPSWPR